MVDSGSNLKETTKEEIEQWCLCHIWEKELHACFGARQDVLKTAVLWCVQVHEGPCASLKRHKLDVERVGKGSECGVLLDGFDVRLFSTLPLSPLLRFTKPRTVKRPILFGSEAGVSNLACTFSEKLLCGQGKVLPGRLCIGTPPCMHRWNGHAFRGSRGGVARA